MLKQVVVGTAPRVQSQHERTAGLSALIGTDNCACLVLYVHFRQCVDTVCAQTSVNA